MSAAIEDYGIIGDCESVALVGSNGSIDWPGWRWIAQLKISSILSWLALARWRALRDESHKHVCQHGFNPRVGTFVQSYGSTALDASLLLIPLLGLLPASD